MAKGRILFVCRGNTCRSQMAAMLVNIYLSEQWIAISGGIKIGNERDCRTATVLQEIGIHSPIPSATLFSSYDESLFDLIITLDEKAEKQARATFPEKDLYHQYIVDPFQKGDDFRDCDMIDDEGLVNHRRTRDEIIERVLPLVRTLTDVTR